MKKSRLIVLLLLTLACGAAALTSWSWFQKNKAFRAENAIADIEVISAQRHSVAAPEQRMLVCEYLQERLRGLGGLVEVHSYPGQQARGYEFDVHNIVADFPAPVYCCSSDDDDCCSKCCSSDDDDCCSKCCSSDDACCGGCSSKEAPYLMLVAHYDSRYPWVPVRDTTCSFGAADDGYGVAVILEEVRLALQKRSEWKQNLRVLFTDAEEVGMVGMKCEYEYNRELFSNVGLLINVEARGPFGPALLFETSKGNEELLDLYEEACSPFTYSLTNVVYSIMPNFTDFTIVKDDIPGLNFSTIADINHYHTSLDNFSFVNDKSIRHYGAQMSPIIEEYLCSDDYSDVDELRSDKDRSFFTIPLLGLWNFSKEGYLVLNLLILALLVIVLIIKRKDLLKSLKYALVQLLGALGAFAAGELIAWLACLVTGASFKPFGVITGVMADNVIMIVAALLLVAVFAVSYSRSSKVELRLEGTLVLLGVLSIVLLAALGENLFTLIPLGATVISLLLWYFSNCKWVLLIGIALILLHAVSFLWALSMALTIGAFGAVLLIACFDLFALSALGRLFVEK